MFSMSVDYAREDLLNFVGSRQTQSGIIWGNKEPTCVIITSGGRNGKSADYGDLINEDGSIFYIGQGAIGDQNKDKYSNSLLINGERTILFFSTREPNTEEVRQQGNYRKLYRFQGIFEVGAWEYYTPNEGRRANNKLLRFHLLTANNIYNLNDLHTANDATYYSKEKLIILRTKIESQSSKPQKGLLNPKEYFKRSIDVNEYALLRAEGVCEKCDFKAPFLNSDKSPYLEVHHIFRLSDDGPDIPENVAAVCPNCHREAHYGINKNDFKTKLATKILLKEKSLLDIVNSI